MATVTASEFFKKGDPKKVSVVSMPQPQPSTQESKPGFFERVGQDFAKRGEEVTKNSQQYAANPTLGNLFQQGFQTAGQFAGGVGDIFKEGLSPAIEGVANKVSDSKFVQDIATSEPVSGGLDNISGAMSSYQKWAEAHPEAAKNLESTVNIASLLPIDAGTKAVTTGVARGMEGAINATKNAVGAVDDTLRGVVGEAKNVVVKPQNALQDALEITRPVMNKKGSISAFEKAGQPGGVEVSGKSKTFSLTPSPRDTEIAESVASVVSSKQGPIENIISVNQKIASIAENEITPFLKSNPSPFNVKTLNAYLRDNTEIPDFIKADPILQKTYELTRQKMVQIANKYPKTSEGLWQARKEFDRVAESQGINLDPTSGQATAIKQAVSDTRRLVNDFIADNVPSGGPEFKAKLRTLSNMYEARGRIAEQNYKLLDKNAIQRWAKQNPEKYGLLKWLVGIGSAGTVVTGIIGD